MSNRKMKSQNSFRSSPCILSQEKKLNYNPNPRSIRIMIHYVETFSRGTSTVRTNIHINNYYGILDQTGSPMIFEYGLHQYDEQCRREAHRHYYCMLCVSVCVCVCVFFPSILDIKFVGRTSRGHTGGRSHRIFHPPSFCGACLDFCREKDSAIPFPRRP